MQESWAYIQCSSTFSFLALRQGAGVRLSTLAGASQEQDRGGRGCPCPGRFAVGVTVASLPTDLKDVSQQSSGQVAGGSCAEGPLSSAPCPLHHLSSARIITLSVDFLDHKTASLGQPIPLSLSCVRGKLHVQLFGQTWAGVSFWQGEKESSWGQEYFHLTQIQPGWEMWKKPQA